MQARTTIGAMAGRRVASNSSDRNLALIILVVGSIAALASMIGSIWVVRAGVVVAVLMAAAALWVVYGEMAALRKEHAEELKHEHELRTALADRHHSDSIAMIDRFNARTNNLQTVIDQLRSQLGAARAELSTMRGNAAWLRGEVAERQARIAQLEARIAELEADRDDHNIVELEIADLHPSSEQIWGDDEHPTMVDLRKVHLEELEMPIRKRA